MTIPATKDLRTYLAFAFFLLASSVTAQAQFLRSTPLIGKAPSEVIPSDTLSYTPFEMIMNPYVQHNNQIRNGKGIYQWYGSGAVATQDQLSGKVTQASVDAINSGVVNPEGDVNGNGEINSTGADATLIQNYVKGSIPQLPGHWNYLDSAEKRSWITNVMGIEIPVPSGDLSGWLCQNFVTRFEMDFDGIANAKNFTTWYYNNEGVNLAGNVNYGWANLPVYDVADYASDGTPHAVAGILVGNNDTTFSDWFFFYFHGNQMIQVKPGDYDMNANKPVVIGKYVYSKSAFDGSIFFNHVPNIITFNLKNGNGTIAGHDPSLIIDNPMKIVPHVESLENLVVDASGVPWKKKITPTYLDSLGYKSIPKVWADSTNLSANLSYADKDSVWTSDSTGLSFNRWFYSWVYSGGITKVDSTEQSISETNIQDPNAIMVNVDSLADFTVNYQKNLNMSPKNLVGMGYDAIPKVTTQNTSLTPVFSYSDAGTTALSKEYPEIHYSFVRTYYDKIQVGDVVKEDSTKNKITVADIEPPSFTLPKDTTISRDAKIDSATIGYPTNVTDNSGLPVNVNYSYNQVSGDSTKQVYDVTWKFTDQFGNDTTGTQKVRKDLLDAIDQFGGIPTAFSLSQNFPNPFNPTTVITYDIAKRSHVTLVVYDVLGRQVATLVNAEKSPGEYQATFNGSDLPSGVYFYRIEAGKYVSTRKLMLVK